MTLIEVLIGTMMLAVAIGWLMSALAGQTTLNDHNRNFAWAISDVSRVMERMRQQNTGAGCTTPSAQWPGGFASWDAWLNDTGVNGGGGKHILPNPAANELVMVTPSGGVPLQVTAAICWRERTRVIGECTWNGTNLVPNDADGNLIFTSPAMLSTVLVCR